MTTIDPREHSIEQVAGNITLAPTPIFLVHEIGRAHV